MKSVCLLLSVLSLSLSAQTIKLDYYKVLPDVSTPLKVIGIDELKTTAHLKNQLLPIRIKVKKFYTIKKPDGFGVRFEPVCEKAATIPVTDLTGGGIVQEGLFGHCPARIKGHDVHVVLTGMVYDNLSYAFNDEDRILRRNFFTHLSLSSSGTILFTSSDFNLGSTTDLPFNYWVSDLSTDNGNGKNKNQVVREGFTASVRYGEAL